MAKNRNIKNKDKFKEESIKVTETDSGLKPFPKPEPITHIVNKPKPVQESETLTKEYIAKKLSFLESEKFVSKQDLQNLNFMGNKDQVQSVYDKISSLNLQKYFSLPRKVSGIIWATTYNI